MLAAAVAARADVIVTANLKDFPPPVCAPLGVEVMHPDDFLLALLDQAPRAVLAALRQQAADLNEPKIARTPEATANAAAYDPDVQRQIWQLSLDLTGAPDPS